MKKKNEIIQKLTVLIKQLNDSYEKFVQKKEDIINLKKIFMSNYFNSITNTNYNIINNLNQINFYCIEIPSIIEE